MSAPAPLEIFVNCLKKMPDPRSKYGTSHPLKHVLRADLGKAWTVLTNGAVSLTRLLWQGERTLREVGEKRLADPRSTAKRLGLKK